jgi:hypothetical protein
MSPTHVPPAIGQTALQSTGPAPPAPPCDSPPAPVELIDVDTPADAEALVVASAVVVATLVEEAAVPVAAPDPPAPTGPSPTASTKQAPESSHKVAPPTLAHAQVIRHRSLQKLGCGRLTDGVIPL